MDISIITSVYRSKHNLKNHIQAALKVARKIKANNLSLQYIFVLNDASQGERIEVKKLSDQRDKENIADIKVLYVPRETLYASWNHGVINSTGRIIGFWNVGDIRTSEALIEGLQLIKKGVELVYFPYYTVIRRKRFSLFCEEQRILQPVLPFDRYLFTREMHAGPFFMFSRKCYDKVGPFDEQFHIAGDYEWCVRAAKILDFRPGSSIGGEFICEGNNLSGTGNFRQTVENNVICLRYGVWDKLEPTDPLLMRSYKVNWDDCSVSIPQEIRERLWGEHAVELWSHKMRTKRRKDIILWLPRFLINWVGIRRIYLERLGLLKPRTQ